jgi:hypothetical protein
MRYILSLAAAGPARGSRRPPQEGGERALQNNCITSSGQEWGQPELRDFCLVGQVLKKRELIGLLLSRAGREPRLQASGCS